MNNDPEAFLNSNSFSFRGKRYVGKEVSPDTGCHGCALARYTKACARAPYCSGKFRRDKRSIIFVLAEDEHVDAENTPEKHLYFPDENKHVIEKAFKIVKAYNDWRRNQEKAPCFPTCFTAQELGEAIDTVLNFIERRIE